MKLAPIVLFVYNRPWHTRQTVEALQKNELARESELFIFSDGPRSENDKKNVQAVREYIKTITGFRSIRIIDRERNLGLAQSIISGVTEIVNRYGRIIVLEDDLIVSRYFLDYMNTALNWFEKDERVMSVSGYMFPIEIQVDTDSVFMPFITSWGWATWKRAWDSLDSNMESYASLKKDSTLRRRFDLNNSYFYFRILKAQIQRKIDSWAIRWYLSVFMLQGLTLFPVRSLVQNIGFDNTGTHTTRHDAGFSEAQKDFHVLTFPPDIEISETVFDECKNFLKSKKENLLSPVKEFINGFITKTL
jgi:hypothetical protein